MDTRKRGQTGFLNPMELRYVAAWEGNNAEAAASAGFNDPKQAARELMSNPAVYRAVLAKQNRIIAESARRLGKRLAKCDTTDRLLKRIKDLKRTMRTIRDRKQIRTADVRQMLDAFDQVVDCYVNLARLQRRMMASLPRSSHEGAGQ